MDCTTLLGLAEVISLEQWSLTIFYYASECEYYACFFYSCHLKKLKTSFKWILNCFLFFFQNTYLKSEQLHLKSATRSPALPPPPPAVTGWKILTDLSCCMFLSYKHGFRILTGLTEIMSLLLLTDHAVSCVHSSMGDFPGSPVIKTLLPLYRRGFHRWSRNWDPTCHMARPQTKTNKWDLPDPWVSSVLKQRVACNHYGSWNQFLGLRWIVF